MQNSAVTGENGLAVSQKVKQRGAYEPIIPFLGIHPRELKTCPHKNLYTSIHRSITYNIPKAETTQMSISL